VWSHQWNSYWNLISDKNLTPLLCFTFFVILCFIVFFWNKFIFLHIHLRSAHFTNGTHGGVTCRKVAGSIPDYVIEIFLWHNPSGRTMALGLTQPLTEMSTRNISWRGKGCRCIGLTTLPYTDFLEIWVPQSPGVQRACLGLYRDFCNFTLHISIELKNDILYALTFKNRASYI
jgi:hypothetical protein